eukprot:TRINITY_DN90805_c0_g1_i1.p1 TRINITY_DN90805_c0_g1~~TRINITY_DN90805_c0_g1_i1.p1  ORF type:complete len:993 (+),score=145.30 TRINITY_DN90805_c0_g1_i1:33-3011(+)
MSKVALVSSTASPQCQVTLAPADSKGDEEGTQLEARPNPQQQPLPLPVPLRVSSPRLGIHKTLHQLPAGARKSSLAVTYDDMDWDLAGPCSPQTRKPGCLSNRGSPEVLASPTQTCCRTSAQIEDLEQRLLKLEQQITDAPQSTGVECSPLRKKNQGAATADVADSSSVTTAADSGDPQGSLTSQQCEVSPADLDAINAASLIVQVQDVKRPCPVISKKLMSGAETIVALEHGLAQRTHQAVGERHDKLQPGKDEPLSPKRRPQQLQQEKEKQQAKASLIKQDSSHRVSERQDSRTSTLQNKCSYSAPHLGMLMPVKVRRSQQGSEIVRKPQPHSIAPVAEEEKGTFEATQSYDAEDGALETRLRSDKNKSRVRSLAQDQRLHRNRSLVQASLPSANSASGRVPSDLSSCQRSGLDTAVSGSPETPLKPPELCRSLVPRSSAPKVQAGRQVAATPKEPQNCTAQKTLPRASSQSGVTKLQKWPVPAWMSMQKKSAGQGRADRITTVQSQAGLRRAASAEVPSRAAQAQDSVKSGLPSQEINYFKDFQVNVQPSPDVQAMTLSDGLNPEVPSQLHVTELNCNAKLLLQAAAPDSNVIVAGSVDPDLPPPQVPLLSARSTISDAVPECWGQTQGRAANKESITVQAVVHGPTALVQSEIPKSPSKPVEEWHESDVIAWLIHSSSAPADIAKVVYDNAITGQVLVSLQERDADKLEVSKFGHRRLLLLAAEEIRSSLQNLKQPGQCENQRRNTTRTEKQAENKSQDSDATRTIEQHVKPDCHQIQPEQQAMTHYHLSPVPAASSRTSGSPALQGGNCSSRSFSPLPLASSVVPASASSSTAGSLTFPILTGIETTSVTRVRSAGAGSRCSGFVVKDAAIQQPWRCGLSGAFTPRGDAWQTAQGTPAVAGRLSQTVSSAELTPDVLRLLSPRYSNVWPAVTAAPIHNFSVPGRSVTPTSSSGLSSRRIILTSSCTATPLPPSVNLSSNSRRNLAGK